MSKTAAFTNPSSPSNPQSQIRTPQSPNSPSPPSSPSSPPSRSRPAPPASTSDFRVPPSNFPQNPQSQIRNPQSLLLDFLSGDVPTEVILADHNLTPEQFLAWIESAETQRQLETIAKIDAARAKAIAATSRADALFSLRRVLMQSKSLGEIRRAASAILRYSSVPRHGGSEPSRAPKDPAVVPIPKAKPAKPPKPTTDAELLATSLATLNNFLAKAAAPKTCNSHSPSLREGAGGRERTASEPDPVPLTPAA